MLRALVNLALRQRVVVVVAAAALIALGIVVASRSPLDVFPEFAPPLVEVQTEAPGMSSEAVEKLVTFEVEAALSGVPHMTMMRSKSVPGLSSVQMFFEHGSDQTQIRQMIAERLRVAATQLPAQVKTPVPLPPLSSTSRVLHVGLTPKRDENGKALTTQTDISVLMQTIVRRRLLAVPGVANVSTYGQHDKIYRVLIKPQDLRDHGVTLEQIKQALQKSVVYGSGGFHDTENQRVPIEVTTRIDNPSDLAHIEVANRKGVPIYLGQVATLDTGNAPHIGEGVINGEQGLFVVVEKYPWANTLEVTRGVEAAIDALRPALSNVQITTDIFRPATFIELALHNLAVAMILGAALVALILIAFLFEWRTALISLLAIPLSIVAALVVLNRMGMTINTMVLAGLAIAIGEVVDDAIIDVENIVRRLKQNRLLPQPRSAFAVVLDASLEVRSAVVYASFIVVFVCLPIFFMGGVAGAFFQPLALAYILAVMASLLVALIVTPALCLMLLPRAVEKSRESPVVRGVRWAYARLLPTALNQKAIVYGGLGVLVVGAGILYTQLKDEYLPPFRESDFLMHWISKPPTSLEAMTKDICRIGDEMLEETPLKAFGSHIARAEVGEEVVGSNFAELWVSLGNYSGDYDEARRKIEAVMARHPGFQHDLLTYLQERIKEVLSGTGATVVLRIYGPELDRLRGKAVQVFDAIRTVDGVIDPKVESQVLVPKLNLMFDPYKVKAYGVKPRDVVDAIDALNNGRPVSEVHQGDKRFEIHVRGHDDVRRTLADLRRLEVDLPGGGTVPLAAVARLDIVSSPNTIRHDKASRCIDVSCNIKGRDLGSVVRDIQTRLAELPPEEGYRVELLGEYRARAENQRQLLGVGALALLGIALLLYMDFQSPRLMLLVMLTLPFALIGGVAAAFFTGRLLSLGSLVGFITVLGIAARNGIMLVSHYRHLER